jgi:hypothetical protein
MFMQTHIRWFSNTQPDISSAVGITFRTDCVPLSEAVATGPLPRSLAPRGALFCHIIKHPPVGALTCALP